MIIEDYQGITTGETLDKLAGMASTGSEIDNSIKSKIIPEGLNEIDDMTSIIQSYIDAQNAIYLSQDERLANSTKIYIPKGKYKIKNLHLKAGISFDMDGVFIPLDSSSDCAFISGSYINIDKLNLSSRNVYDYSGKLLSLDTTNTDTVNFLDNFSKLSRVAYVNIKTLNIMGSNSNTVQEYGVYIKSDILSRGISWINILKILVRNCYFGIVCDTDNDGYINSNIINGYVTSCVKSLYLNNQVNGGISNNFFDIHYQARDNSEATAITSYLASSNTFLGAIWDWLDTYSDVIYDTGNRNVYHKNLVSASFYHKVKILGNTSLYEDTYESNTDSFYNLFHWNENSRNGIGYQDNLLSFANKRFNVTVSPYTPSTLSKIFTQAVDINHYANNTWPSANGGGEIVYTITNIPQCRMHSITIGFTKAERIARGVKLEIKLSTGNWVTLTDVSNNLNTVFTYRANGGSGHDLDSIRLTFTNGANVKDGIITAPLSNILSIQSIVAFGAGERKVYLPYYEATFSNFSSIESSIVPNNSMFVDSTDNKMKFKDSLGVINLLY